MTSSSSILIFLLATLMIASIFVDETFADTHGTNHGHDMKQTAVKTGLQVAGVPRRKQSIKK
jgi:sensor histidine kinase regulating citrate/malate metabolism